MAMTINTNVVSINAQRNLGLSGNSLGTTMQRLSSGLRVNSAKDDAAGLAIAERMNAQAKGLAVASRNANDGISLAQTAEGALGKMGDMLQRMRELAVQSSNATNSEDDRKALQAEVTQLTNEIDRVAKTTTFNGRKILDGSFAGGVFQVGASAGDNITVAGITNAKANALSDITYAQKDVTVAKDAVTGFDTEVTGLQIKVGTEATVSLDNLGVANSESERLGQVVAAINAKTADTGVTAFLKAESNGSHTIELLSAKTDADGNALQVNLLGFTADATGIDGTYTQADFVAVAGLARDAIAATTTFGAMQGMWTAVNADLASALDETEVGDWEALNDETAADVITSVTDAQAAFDALYIAWADAKLTEDLAGATSGAALTGGWDSTNDKGIESLSVATQAGAWKALMSIDDAIDQVNSARADLGALQTRFEKSIENIDIMNENISAARGRIVDTDFAAETANLSRSQILQQAGTAMVAQANQLPQNVLQLLQ